ncbi:MAG: hypothetical protein BA864_06895 [Desulfuromonadales bacterium C00003093]|nr:MAG: hypothetical protein BA864_06895 [Desulfuromonadales bacterium C00003093]
MAGTVFSAGRGDSIDIAERKQIIAECSKLAETTSTLSIYFTDTARRLELCEDVAGSGLAENIHMIRELLTVLRCGVGEIERTAAGCDVDIGKPSTLLSLIDGVVASPSKSNGAVHIYTVGIMTHTARIRAPNPTAAVVFYGTLTSGNALFAAVVYAVDGEKYTGDTAPMMDVQLGKRELSPEELRKIRDDLNDCEVVEWGSSLAAAPQ